MVFMIAVPALPLYVSPKKLEITFSDRPASNSFRFYKKYDKMVFLVVDQH